MSKKKLSEQLNIEISISKPQSSEPNPNKKNTGTYQHLGSCGAKITTIPEEGEEEGITLFENLRGFIGLSVINDRSSLIVNYDNAPKPKEGEQSYPTSRPSDELAAMLQVATIETLNTSGYMVNKRDEQVAEDAGIDVTTYTEMSKGCINIAADLAAEARAKSEKEGTNVSDDKMSNDMEKTAEEA